MRISLMQYDGIDANINWVNHRWEEVCQKKKIKRYKQFNRFLSQGLSELTLCFGTICTHMIRSRIIRTRKKISYQFFLLLFATSHEWIGCGCIRRSILLSFLFFIVSKVVLRNLTFESLTVTDSVAYVEVAVERH